MAEQEENGQQFVRAGILQARIRDRERQAALGRGLGALLQNRQQPPPPVEEEQEEAPSAQQQPVAPLPTLSIEDRPTPQVSRPPVGMQGRALLDRISGMRRGEPGQAFQALFQAMGPSPEEPATDEQPIPALSRPMPVRQPDAISDDDLMVPVRGATFPLARDFMVLMMDLELIHPNPFVPLSRIDKDGLDRLIESIKAHGFLRPLVVMPSTLGNVVGTQTYWLISGERSWQAARIMGTQRVPVRIHEVAPREAIQMVLADDWHIQRLPAMDRARLCGVLREQMGMDVEEISERLAVPADQIESTLRYLDLESEIQDSLNNGQLSEAAAQALCDVEDPDLRMDIWKYAVRHRWNPARIERALRARLEREANTNGRQN